MADPATWAAFVEGLKQLWALQSFLPKGGGPNRLLIDTIKGATAAIPERGTLGTVPFPSSPPLVPIPGRPTAPPPLPPRGFPTGSSLPDRLPGRVIGAGAILSRVFGWGAGALFWPSEAGRGSELCIETDYGPWCPPGLPNVPAPVAVPGSRGRRRPRAVPSAPGRRRRRAVTVPGAVPAAPPRPRGRPVTISRPRIETRPDVVAVVRTPPMQSRPPMPASIPQAQEMSLPRGVPAASSIPRPVVQAAPTQVPSWVRELARLAPAVLGVPLLGNWVGAPNVRPNLAPPSVGPVPSFPIPGLGPSPLPGLAPAPLTAFNTAPALSPSQELDRQCRERAQRKRKKRKPRTECWKGSYVETRKGTRKTRRERIKCQ